MFEKVAIFFIFLTPLIFFHELGHFLFARLFGIRVETFSIGFGPRIWSKRRGATDYVISLIPFGGYVKMFGDDRKKADEISPQERKESFLHQSIWARFWVVFGGPLANFILAFFLYYALFLTGESYPELKFGRIPVDTPYFQTGLRPGDVLNKLNGNTIISPEQDLNSVGENIEEITVMRDGVEKTFPLFITTQKFFRDFFTFYKRKPVLVDQAGKAYLFSLDAKNWESQTSLEELIAQGAQEGYLKEIFPNGEIVESAPVITIPLNGNTEKKFFESLPAYFPIDLVIDEIVSGSAGEKAGLIKGDIIARLQGETLTSFEDLRGQIQEFKNGEEVALEVLRKGEMLKISLVPEVLFVEEQEVKRIGIKSGIQVVTEKLVQTDPRGMMESVPLALKRTYVSMGLMLDGFKKLITSEVSIKNLGGPITIGVVASNSFDISLSKFFALMAFISINLGIFNLFPIPVLDGGHLMFLFLEMINRGPLSIRKIEIAQQIGVSIILALILFALINDFSRFF